MSPRPVNATRADIVAMLQNCASNNQIVRELHCDKKRVIRLRAELDLPSYTPVERTRTVEQKWALFAMPVEDGHVRWRGERATDSGTPLLRYKESCASAAAVAFRIKHGRPSEGYVVAECGMKHCVAPEHVNDEAGRLAACENRRTVRKSFCPHCHDQTVHGRYERRAMTYCGACKLAQARDVRPRVAAMLRDGIQEYRIARELQVSVKKVAAIRAELGLPASRSGRRPLHASMDAAFLARVESLDGGHARWPGKTSLGGQPVVKHRGTTASAYRIGFRIHYGRAPEGLVRPGCGMPGCVAGWHLEDRIVRERTETAYAALFGVVA